MLAVPCPDDTVVDRGAADRAERVVRRGSMLRYVLIMTDPAYDSSASAPRYPTNTTAARLVDALPSSTSRLAHPDAPLYAQNNRLPAVHVPAQRRLLRAARQWPRCARPMRPSRTCSRAAGCCGGCVRAWRAVVGAWWIWDVRVREVSDRVRSEMIDALLIGGSAVIAALLLRCLLDVAPRSQQPQPCQRRHTAIGDGSSAGRRRWLRRGAAGSAAGECDWCRR